MEKLLTKSDIINGKKNIKKIEVEALGGCLEIAPLTEGQMSQVEIIVQSAMVLKGRKKRGSDEFDIFTDTSAGEAKKANDEANYLAISYSLTNAGKERWTPEDIRGFPVHAGENEEDDLIEFIAAEVYKLTGKDPRKRAKKLGEEANKKIQKEAREKLQGGGADEIDSFR